MIITGDIACPGEEFSRNLGEVLEENNGIFSDNTLIFNLEGLIADDFSSATNTPVLFSHAGLLRTLQNKCGNVVAALANNHTLDIPGYFDHTLSALQRNNVLFTGAGKSRSDAEEPARFEENGGEIFLFNYCWDFLLYHQKNPSEGVYVAEISELDIIEKIQTCRNSNPEASIVVFFHWSIDLETLPYPMYRQFSKALIDNGANLVAGAHSHCVQGGEKYKNGYIVYGLGNFYIPWNVYANGKLDFPEFSKTILALEWDPATNRARCHWFEYDEEEKSLSFLDSEEFENSKRLRHYSPYRDMNDEEYISYFRENRRKRFLIPVYTDYKRVWLNKWLTFLIKTRARTARTLAKFNLIKWQS